MMKPYAQYKDSGVEWIGEIPEVWQLGKVSYFYHLQLGKMLQPDKKTDSDTQELYLCAVHMSESGISTEIERKMWFSSDEKKIFSIEKGDLLIVEGGDVGLSCMYTEDKTLYIQNALHRVRPYSNILNKMLYYWLIFIKSIGYMDLVCNKATIAHYTKEKLSNTPFIAPPLETQQKIVAYLDKKTTAIDTLISSYEKLLVLLAEKRQAIISEAVTKGLDPNAPMKDSLVEWIGEIPVGWGLVKLKFLTKKIGSGKTPKGGSEVYTKDGIIFLRSQNIYNTGLVLDEVAYITEGIDQELANSRLIENDILLNITGGSIGRVCIWNLPNKQGNVNQHVCIIRGNERYLPKMTHFLFMSVLGERFIEQAQTGGNREGLNFEDIGNFPVPLPPCEVQEQIVQYLDEKTSKIDQITTDTKEQIKLLKEYRQSLISEVVTGKIEV